MDTRSNRKQWEHEIKLILGEGILEDVKSKVRDGQAKKGKKEYRQREGGKKVSGEGEACAEERG